MSTYIDRLKAGDLLTRLKTHADEYLGPGGQSATIQQANHIKRQTLLEAAEEISLLRQTLDALGYEAT